MKMKKILSLMLSVMMMLSMFGALTTTAAPQIKNIIYMIPDGGGMEPFYLADAVKAAGGFYRSVYPNATQQTVNKMY